MAALIRSLVLIAVLLHSTMAWSRDSNWATPLTLEGVPNLHLVAPNLYRSAQPTAAGFNAAENKLKLRAVLDLRNFHSDVDLIKGTRIRLNAVPMTAWSIKTNDVILALKVINAAQAKGAVLVHCEHGADRTGVVLAMYRIVYQGWSKQQALDEMKNGGYNFHGIFSNIPKFIQNADVTAYKRALAIVP